MFVQNQPFSFDLFWAYTFKFCVFIKKFCSFLIHIDQKNKKEVSVKQLSLSPYFLKESCGSSHNFKFYPDSYYEILEAILSEREVRRKKFLNASFLYKDGMR